MQLRLLFSQHLSDTKIRYYDTAIDTEKYVICFDVPMYDTFGMDDIHPQNDLLENVGDHVLINTIGIDVEETPKAASFDIFHEDIDDKLVKVGV